MHSACRNRTVDLPVGPTCTEKTLSAYIANSMKNGATGI